MIPGARGIAVLVVAGFAQAALAAQPPGPGPQFTASGELQRPADYRSWVFVTSGLGMTYGPNAPAPGQPAPFSNVFVNPASYRAFLTSGRWPDPGGAQAIRARQQYDKASQASASTRTPRSCSPHLS